MSVYFDAFGQKEEAIFYVDQYRNNGRLFVGMYTLAEPMYWEPFDDVTVNLPHEQVTDKSCCGFINVNNFEQLPKILEENGLAEPTGKYGFSGWCSYPEYRFNMDALKEHMAAKIW